MPKHKNLNLNLPRLYLWFTSFSSGDHCNTIGASASEIAREMVEVMEDNLGEVDIKGKTKSERIVNIYGKISEIGHGFDSAHFEFEKGSWSTITLADHVSQENAKRILSEVKQNQKESRKHKKQMTK